MKKTIWTAAMAALMALVSAVPQAAAATGQSVTFRMARASAATCISENAYARVTLSDLGSVQNMHVEVVGLTPNNEFTLFVIQHPNFPFGISWYQGDIETDATGRGVGDFTGIFSAETFVLTDTPVQLDHLGIWFAASSDAIQAGCPSLSTPFDGDHEAGILVLSTSNFPDGHGPLLKLKEEE